jgi:flagellin
MSTITLSAGVRASLTSIQQAAAAAQQTQLRLSTGKRVNSALDNPSNFFTSAGLNARANDLKLLQDSIGQGIKTLEAADKGLTAITKLLESAQGLARSARAASDAATRTSLAAQFDEVLNQIDDITEDSGYNGVNLLKATPDSLTVIYNEKTGANQNKSVIVGADMTTGAAGLNITDAAATWTADAAGDTAIDAKIATLTTAVTTVRAQASKFGASLTIVQNRQDFTSNLITTLKNGADALVLADSNEEGANLLALSTRQQLAQTALSLASQSDQAVLRLF